LSEAEESTHLSSSGVHINGGRALPAGSASTAASRFVIIFFHPGLIMIRASTQPPIPSKPT
jgi:hypothetical protein